MDHGISTDDEQFNDWVNRSKADLLMLTNETGQGLYPYAGVPWYGTVFGRDGIITAFQTLWMKPQIARGGASFFGQDSSHCGRRSERGATRQNRTRDSQERNGQAGRGTLSADGSADLVLTRDRDAVSVGVSKRIGNIEVSTIS
jgi:hypothetical protein